jgi:hypothetical protein
VLAKRVRCALQTMFRCVSKMGLVCLAKNVGHACTMSWVCLQKNVGCAKQKRVGCISKKGRVCLAKKCWVFLQKGWGVLSKRVGFAFQKGWVMLQKGVLAKKGQICVPKGLKCLLAKSVVCVAKEFMPQFVSHLFV